MTKLILAFFLLISQVVIGANYNTHLNSILTIENNNVRLDIGLPTFVGTVS